MYEEEITNANVMSIDFNRQDRLAFLQSIPNMNKHKMAFIIPGLRTADVWMNDVSSMDRRSVKAHLAGSGDSRVLRWKINCFLQLTLNRQATLKQMVIAIFRRQHRFIVARFKFSQDFRGGALGNADLEI